MRTIRLANYIAAKYKIAEGPTTTIAAEGPTNLEKSLKNDIEMLHKYPHNLFVILEACATTNPGNPKSPSDLKALLGYGFCRDLLKNINWLFDHKETVDLAQMREILIEIISMIDKNKHLTINDSGKVVDDVPKSNVQFPHVSELIFRILSSGTKSDRRARDTQFQKAKKGLERIFDLSSTMLKKISKLEIVSPEKFYHKHVDDKEEFMMPERFDAQRANLSSYDIVDFIRQYGDIYGLDTKEEWSIAVDTDPQLRNDLTTIINALNRGHYPRDSQEVKHKISDIMQKHYERISNNVSALENEGI